MSGENILSKEMDEKNLNAPNVTDWLEALRKSEAEQSAQASAIIEKHLKGAGLPFKKTGETETWSGVSWDLYINIHELLGNQNYSEMLTAMLAELVDFCEVSTSESFAYKLKILFEKFIDRDPPRSKFTMLLPEKAFVEFGEIEEMMFEDHERYLEILNQQGY